MSIDYTRQAMQAQNYLTAKEAADFLNISVDTIHRWEKSGIVAEWHLSAGIDDVLLEADEKKSKN